ncbi:hypothetical protein MKX01_000202 [Papaver californicum]|nr:hypothetical protein MKX01_000202 [Papaver californicum]
MEKEAALLAIRWTQQLSLDQVQFESDNLKVFEALGDRIIKTKRKTIGLQDSNNAKFQLCVEKTKSLKLITAPDNIYATKFAEFCFLGNMSRSWVENEPSPILLDLMNSQDNQNYLL